MKPVLLANYPVQYHQNDTWTGFTLKGICVDSSGNRILGSYPPKLIHAILQFRDKRGILAYELNSETAASNGLPDNYPNNTKGTITIEDSDDWFISVNAQPLKLDAGTYYWELQIQDCNNVFASLVRGKLIVTQDITY